MRQTYTSSTRLFGPERIAASLASAVIPCGMILALVSLSDAGRHIQKQVAAISTFELAAIEGAQEKSIERPMPPEQSHAMPQEQASDPELGKPAPTPEIPSRVMEPANAAPIAQAPGGSEQPAPAEPSAAPSASNQAAAASKPQSEASAGAASATYKGKVWQHLQRYRKPNVVGPGSAFVGFSLEYHGRLTQLAIVTSSGSSRFDGEALQMVRRAEPFPPPPQEIRPSFVFEIKGN